MDMVFGPWLPDLAPANHEALTLCENVYPVANGYAPVGGFAEATTALTGWTGGGAFISASGQSHLLSGNSAGLHRFSGVAWNSLFAASAGKWRMAQNRVMVVAVHGGSPVGYNLTTGVAAALGGTPPAASYVATVGNFTILAGDPANVMRWNWSGYANPEIWDGSNQSGSQDLADGGAITGLAGGEIGLIFQRGAIHRIQYIGGDSTWHREKYSKEVGCIAAGSIAQAGAMTFFLSERGFMRTDGNSVEPIGNEAVDRTFFAAYQRSDLDRLTAATDPRHYCAYWAMPGNPGRIWCYNWMLQKWSVIAVPMAGVLSAFTSNIGMDALDTLYPGGLDTMLEPLDSPRFAGGEPRFYVVSPEGKLGTLTGPNLAVKLRTGFGELSPGRATRINRVRPETDAAKGVTITIESRRRLGDSDVTRKAAVMRPSGDVPLRAEGRALRLQCEIAAGERWNYIQGAGFKAAAGGR